MFAIRYDVEPVVELWERQPPAVKRADACTQVGYVGQLGLAAYTYIYREAVPASNTPVVVKSLMPAVADIAEVRATLSHKSNLLNEQLAKLQAYVLDAIDTSQPYVVGGTFPPSKHLIVFKNARITESRDKAYHVDIGLHSVWLPRSLTIVGRDSSGQLFIAIPRWLANKHTLLAHVEPVDLPAVDVAVIEELRAGSPAKSAPAATATQSTAPRGTTEPDLLEDPPF